MNASTITRITTLTELKWVRAMLRDTSKPVGSTGYGVAGDHVYKREINGSQYNYFRVPISQVFHLTYWSDIQPNQWEAVDVYGIPLNLAKPAP